MITLALVAEDRAAVSVVQHLTDQALLEVDWIAADNLSQSRCWQQFDGEDWLPWKKVAGIARQTLPTFRVSGHFDGKPGAEDALAVRKVIAFLQAQSTGPAVFVLARDIDHTDRRTGFTQALAEAGSNLLPCRVVLALAQPEVEAWFVCVWKAEDQAGKAKHAELRQLLGFDPVARSHELTSTSSSKRDAKVVLNHLAAAGPSPREQFFALTCEDLLKHGEFNGLTHFVEGLRSALHAHLQYRKR